MAVICLRSAICVKECYLLSVYKRVICVKDYYLCERVHSKQAVPFAMDTAVHFKLIRFINDGHLLNLPFVLA